MSTPLVTVVIPTYNRSQALRRALASVARQTLTDYEVIVVDDGSTDDTTHVVSQCQAMFGTAMRSIRCERNSGGAAARNKAIQVARTPYIALLDADDEWLPTKLEKQLARFSELPPQVGLVTTGYRHDDQAGRPISHNPINPKQGDLSSAIVDSVAQREEIVGVFSTLMLRRQVIDEVGLLDESLTCWHDTDFYIRAAERFHFAFMPESLSVKHERADSISHSWPLQAVGTLKFWQKHRRRFDTRPRFKRYLAGYQQALGMQACLAGHAKEGRRLFRRALTLSPGYWTPAAHLALACAGSRAYSAAVATGRRLRHRQ